MEEAGPAPKNHVLACPKVERKPGARVNVVGIGVHRCRRPGFPLVAHTEVHGEVGRDLPLVLNEEAIVGVVHLALGQVANLLGNPGSLKDGRTVGKYGRLGEVAGGVVALEKDHERRAGLKTVRALGSQQARKVSLERIEEREGFLGLDPVEISAETHCVFASSPGRAVGDLKPGLPVEIRVAAIDACGEGIDDLQVWLRAGGEEIEKASRILHAKVVHEGRSESGGQAGHHRVIVKEVVLESRRQVGAVVEGRDAYQLRVAEEIANEQVVVGSQGNIHFRQYLVVVKGLGLIEVFRRESEQVGLGLVDEIDVVQDNRVVEG